VSALATTLTSLNVGWIVLGYAVIMAVLLLIFRKSKKIRPYTGQMMVVCGICLFALLFFILTFAFKVSKMATGATASTMPRTWCVALLPISILCIISILNGSSNPDEPFQRWKFVIGVTFAVFASVFLFSYIGYYLSSALFIVLLMWLLGERKAVTLVAVPVIWDVFTYLVFARVLYISLPIGALFELIL
jgi:putative tricarboxylic transport membrane protein